MAKISDLVEDWIQMRATLQQQVKQLESGYAHAGGKTIDARTEATLARLKGFIGELNALLKDYAGAH